MITTKIPCISLIDRFTNITKSLTDLYDLDRVPRRSLLYQFVNSNIKEKIIINARAKGIHTYLFVKPVQHIKDNLMGIS